MDGLGTPELLRRAAALPEAPKRLTRAADAVLEGKFTWDDVVAGNSDHPLAVALRSPKARRVVQQFLDTVADRLTHPAPEDAEQARASGDDEDFSQHTYLYPPVDPPPPWGRPRQKP